MWPFKKPEDRWEFSSDSVPLSTLVRWYMYDAGVDTPNKAISFFNMTPVSEEGAEKEQQDSNARIKNVLALFPFLAISAEINAKTIASLQKEDMAEHGQNPAVLEQEFERMTEFYEQMSFSALVTAFSAAAELGLVQVTGIFSELGDTSDE
jgi:hypothetical protein